MTQLAISTVRNKLSRGVACRWAQVERYHKTRTDTDQGRCDYESRSRGTPNQRINTLQPIVFVQFSPQYKVRCFPRAIRFASLSTSLRMASSKPSVTSAMGEHSTQAPALDAAPAGLHPAVRVWGVYVLCYMSARRICSLTAAPGIRAQ